MVRAGGRCAASQHRGHTIDFLGRKTTHTSVILLIGTVQLAKSVCGILRYLVYLKMQNCAKR